MRELTPFLFHHVAVTVVGLCIVRKLYKERRGQFSYCCTEKRGRLTIKQGCPIAPDATMRELTPFLFYYPDAHIITGEILYGDPQLTGKPFSLILPKLELGSISSNDKIGLGIVNKNICICISRVPDDVNNNKIEEWLSSWDCTTQ